MYGQNEDDGRGRSHDALAWRTIGSRRLHDSPWFAFRLDEVELPGGERIDYGVVEGHDVTFVAATTPEGRMLFVRQWRQPLGRTALSLPGGIVDAGEDIALSAARELREETGYTASNMRKLASYHSSPGRTTEVFHLFACQANRQEHGPAPDPTEYMDVTELYPEEISARIRTSEGDTSEGDTEGETTDSGTLLALCLLGHLGIS